MTLLLRGSFVVASALTWVAVVVLAVGLWRARQGRPARELPADVAGQAALLFAGVCLVTATAFNGFASRAVSDVLLYAAVFGMAAASLTWFSHGPALQSRPSIRLALQGLSYALPVGAGALAGIVGTA